MNIELPQLSCPFCNTPFPFDNKHYVITCTGCRKQIQIVTDKDKVVSVRRFISHSYHDDAFIDYVEKNLPIEKWGFIKTFQSEKGNMVIYDSEFCRVKFLVGASDYYPMFDTKIYYGRLHALDNEDYIHWNSEKCICWHWNIIGLAIPFIKKILPQELAENTAEIWESLVKPLNVDYPSFDYIEYPLRLHAKIWEFYGKALFSIFDLRNPELWEEYSKYSNEYNEVRRKKWDLLPDAIEKIC
jgi:hypothetical protein